jgi:hypothetical protein
MWCVTKPRIEVRTFERELLQDVNFCQATKVQKVRAEIFGMEATCEKVSELTTTLSML